MEFETLKNYVDGRWVASQSSEARDAYNPLTGKIIARAPLSTVADVNGAVTAAKGAFQEWRETPPLTRAQYMFRLKEVMENRFEDLAQTNVQRLVLIVDIL